MKDASRIGSQLRHCGTEAMNRHLAVLKAIRTCFSWMGEIIKANEGRKARQEDDRLGEAEVCRQKRITMITRQLSSYGFCKSLFKFLKMLRDTNLICILVWSMLCLRDF